MTAINLEDLGEIVVPSPLPKLSKTPGKIKTLGPRLGEHNVEIYETLLGVSNSRLTHLRKKGVI
jgi:succinyl-CoA:(S)-malate CoA-transferase subunit B